MEEFIIKKAFEISYALHRIGQCLDNHNFSELLGSEALALLRSATRGEYREVQRGLSTIGYVVKLSCDVNLLDASSSDLLLREINILNSAVAEFSSAPNSPDLAPIFSEKLPSSEKYHRGSVPGRHSAGWNGNEINQTDFSLTSQSDHLSGSEEMESDDPSAERKTAILDKIRQSGNCRFKDLQDLLPDISERTIRYDLQSIINEGLIERFGGGGPSISYRIKESGNPAMNNPANFESLEKPGAQNPDFYLA